MKQNSITIVLIVLILLVFSGLLVLYLRIQSKSNTSSLLSTLFNNSSSSTNKTTLPGEQTRGYKEDGPDLIIYQFPVQLLSDVSLKDNMYTARATPFGSLTEEFSLHLGLENQSLPFGTCTFTDSGKISGTASWELMPVARIIPRLTVGDVVLVRLTYPTNPVGDKIEYTKELAKRIEMIENNEQIDYILPYSLCIDKQL